MYVSFSHNHKIEKRKSTVFFRQYRGYRFSYLHIKMPCHSEIGQSKSLFLLTVVLLCFQAKKLPFSHGNSHSDWLREWLFLYNYRIIYKHKHKRFTFLYLVMHNNSSQCGQFLSRPFPGSLSVIWNN